MPEETPPVDVVEPAAKRQRTEEPAAEKGAGNAGDVTPVQDSKVPMRSKKKKPYAFAFGYIGTGYFGLQYHEGFKTIEEDVAKAVHAAGGISEENMKKGESGLSPLQRVSWMRASRTDKGVHAVMNCISLKMLEPIDPAQFVDAVNRNLPRQIKMYSAVKVTGSFNSKTAVSHRYYSYVLPTFAFLDNFRDWFNPDNARLNLDYLAEEAKDSSDEGEDKVEKFHNSAVARVGKYSTVPDEMFEKLCAYRMSEKTRTEVEAIMAAFVGTNYYHNYTKNKAPGEASSQRYITEYKIERIEMMGGVEVATVSIKGAAFMIHQIRRMIAMAILCYNAKLGTTFIKRTLGKDEKIPVPTAPSTGLLLNKLVFGFYDKKLASLKRNKQEGAADLPYLEFKESAPAMDAMHASIRKEIMDQELAGRVMACWVRSVPHILHAYLGVDIYTDDAASIEAKMTGPFQKSRPELDAVKGEAPK